MDTGHNNHNNNNDQSAADSNGGEGGAGAATQLTDESRNVQSNFSAILALLFRRCTYMSIKRSFEALIIRTSQRLP